MTSAAILEDSTDPTRPRGMRRTLRLEAAARTGGGASAPVTVHNISATGLLIETRAELSEGEGIALDLPEAPATAATVVWSSGAFHGCRFDAVLGESALGAAQLRAGPLPAGVAAAESFGLKLQRLRKARGLSLSQVASVLGVSKPTVWAWEQGKARPVEDRLDAIADVLGVPLSEIRQGPDVEALSDLVAQCRERIAAASGTSADRVRILIEL